MIVHIWEYQVPAAAEVAFLRNYGPVGSWVSLFRCGSGHVETLLLRDADVPGRYVTVDRWESAAAYRAFRERFAEEYAALDRVSEALTDGEARVGSFVEVG